MPLMGTASPKPAPGSGRLARRKWKQERAIPVTKAEKRAQLADVEAGRERRLEVFMRDHGCNRADGTPLVFEGGAMKTRAHVHHVVFRSQGGSDDTLNLVTLSSATHNLIHTVGSLTITGNADETLTFVLKNLETGKEIRKWDSPNPSAPATSQETV